MQTKLHAGYGHPLLRAWHGERALLHPSQLVLPLFIHDQPDTLQLIPGLPDTFHIGLDRLQDYVSPLVAKGLRAVLLFGVPSTAPKDASGSAADDPAGPVVQGTRRLRAAFPDLYVICDVCLCAYTSHGHCGLLYSDGRINNPASTDRLAQVALAYAEAGAHMVAPSDMMDNRVGAIKAVLQKAGRTDVAVMSYAAKFASSLYGPFRSACATSLRGNRADYQLPCPAEGLARRAILRDVGEGADVIMVKPGLAYLDIVRLAREISDTPVAVYQVSGEYAMLKAAAAAGAIAEKDAVLEVMTCFRRAGADIIITYYTPQLLDWLAEQ